jgi:hypothetical protein
LARLALCAAIASAGASYDGPAQAGLRARKAALEHLALGLGRIETLSPTAWLTGTPGAPPRYRLAPDQSLTLLQRFANPAVERAPEWRTFWSGRYGPRRTSATAVLRWNTLTPAAPFPALGAPHPSAEVTAPTLRAPVALEDAFQGLELAPVWALEAVATPEPRLVPVAPVKRCAPWQRSKPVSIYRYGAEHDVFQLLDCDGSVASDALDRLSVLARQPMSPRPSLPLPPEPLVDNEFGEWLPELKLVHPRLVWLLENIAQAFPGRAVYIYSGYRRDGHGSLHRQGRALDLAVRGVPNEDVFKYCRTLRDVGCGYYPNSAFVHVDVRPFGTGHPMWIDASLPGTPSDYRDSWPGIAEQGALEWAGDG